MLPGCRREGLKDSRSLQRNLEMVGGVIAFLRAGMDYRKIERVGCTGRGALPVGIRVLEHGQRMFDGGPLHVSVVWDVMWNG